MTSAAQTLSKPSTTNKTSDVAASDAGSVTKLVRDEKVTAIARDIRGAIQEEDGKMRKEYPWLNHQDAIGLGLVIGSVLIIAALSLAFCRGALGWWWAVPLIALPLSVLHEIEHDLIHNQYFAHSRFQDVLYMVIWIFKLHGNPWYRRKLHLKHHMLSGQLSDAEERLIGMGMPMAPRRLAVTSHPMGSILRTALVAKDASYIDENKLKKANAPMVAVFFFVTRTFLIYQLVFLLAPLLGWEISTLRGINTVYPFVRNVFFCLCVPNIIRQASLQAMSNASHYFGDIPLNSVFHQNQILDAWVCLPFNMFCFNFGATHIVHHYLPGQPFYLRHVVARRIREFMESKGVRRNDLGVLSRENRYILTEEENRGSTRTYWTGTAWFILCAVVGVPLFVVWDLWIAHQLNVNIVGHIKRALGKGSKEALHSVVPLSTDPFCTAPEQPQAKSLNGASTPGKLDLMVLRLESEEITSEQVDSLSEAAAQDEKAQ